ncbi:tRNA (guanine(10)-N2)-methyltransferase [Balamuthia mandrillaris]
MERQEERREDWPNGNGMPFGSDTVEYLCYFYHQRLDFRLPELHALAQMFGHPLRYSAYDPERPFIRVKLPSEQAAKDIASRSVLIKGFFEVWGTGETYEELMRSIEDFPLHKKEPYYSQDTTFKLNVDAFGRRYSRGQQLDIIKRFAHIPFLGKVDLKNAQHSFWIMEELGHLPEEGSPPRMIYFGRQIALGARHLIEKFTLKKRGYLGTTSMSSEWSLLMANQGMVLPNHLVYDPFAGTGSILVPPAYFGAKVMGSDIDPRVLRGKEGRSIFTNFAQYDLKGIVDLVVSDTSRPCWRPSPWFDAVICDPPYGVRAGGKKVGKKDKPGRQKAKQRRVESSNTAHIPQCVSYEIPEVLKDLIDFSARTLKLGGRLVYWLPTTDLYQESDLPRHPCLQLRANSEHIMTRRLRRRLITMEKILDFDLALHANLPLEEYGVLSPTITNIGDYYFKRGQYAEVEDEDEAVEEEEEEAATRRVKKNNKRKQQGGSPTQQQ